MFRNIGEKEFFFSKVKDTKIRLKYNIYITIIFQKEKMINILLTKRALKYEGKLNERGIIHRAE